MNTKRILQTKLNNAIGTYIAGGVFTQIAEALQSEFYSDQSPEGKYIKNKLSKTIAEVNKLVRPIISMLDKNGQKSGAAEINNLVNLVADIASLDDKERKRIENLLKKIKDERYKRDYGNVNQEEAA